MRHITTTTIPESIEADAIYILPPVNADEAFYQARTCRHLGWISEDEQQMLKQATIGIAGLGGMGSPVAEIMLRLGIGTLKIAELDILEATNINRQMSASRENIGKPKILETARALRRITDDTTLILYPRGINEAEVEDFAQGCDIIVDVVEFWAIAARIMLHQAARKAGITVVNGNPVGFGSRFFVFRPNGMDIETYLGITLNEAKILEQKKLNKTISDAEQKQLIHIMVTRFFQSPPHYAPLNAPHGHSIAVGKRLAKKDAETPVLASNLPMAAGFVANWILIMLLEKASLKRPFLKQPPNVPDYIYFDAAKMSLQHRKHNIWEKFRRWTLLKALSHI